MINYQFNWFVVISGWLVCACAAHAVEQGDTVWVVDDATPFRQPLGVEVTGTAILNPSSKKALPVQVLERKDIERLGVATMGALLQRLAVMVNNGELGQSILRPSPETAAIHGYEAGTLVLLNGRRLGIYPLMMISANADQMVPDVGMVPLRAIERVEILTDGASARYGSDAMAGVLNIITRGAFDGWEVGAAAQLPSGAGGTERSGSLSWGRGGQKNDTWGLQWHLSWRQRDGVVASQRGLTSAERRRMGSTPSGEAVYAKPSAAITSFGAPAQRQPDEGEVPACDAPFAPVREYAALDGFLNCVQDNGNRFTLYPDERQINLLGSWTWDWRPGTQLFADVLLNDYSKTMLFTNPAGVVTASDTGKKYLLMADPLGSRQITERTLSRLLTGGIQGQTGWADYKLTLSHAHHLGTATGRGGGAPAWAGQLRLSEEVLRQHPAEYSADTLAEFARVRAKEDHLVDAFSESHQAEALLSGRWDSEQGLENRWALGGSFLQDSIVSVPLFSRVDKETRASRRSMAAFGELEMQLSERLLAGVALRHDHYSDVGTASTGKLKAQWRFSSQGFVRMGWGTGFRAPSLRQLDPQQIFTLVQQPASSPPDCDYSQGYEGRGTNVQCVGSEIYNVGNPALRPERGRNFNLGVRYEPSARWSWGVDYWSLQAKDTFGSLNYTDILADPALYARYATLPAPGTPERIYLLAQNLGRLDRRGIDYDLHFRQPTDWGRVRVSLGGTYYLRSKRAFASGQPLTNELGVYLYQTERFIPRSKVHLLLQLDRPTWSYTAIVDAMSGNTESVDGVTAAGVPVSLTRRVPMHWTLDVMAKHTPSRGVELYAGIDNVFDRLPPARYASPASQGYVPGLDTRYGSYQGRTFRLGLNLKF